MINQPEAHQKLLPQTNVLALLYLLVACFILSAAPVTAKWSEQEISPTATVFVRYFMGAVVFGIGSSWDFVQAKTTCDRPLVAQIYSQKTILLLLGAGICSTTNQLFWAWSLTETKIGTSSLMHSLTPLFTTLFAWLFLRRSFDRKFLAGMAIALAGSFVIGISDIQLSSTQLQGDGLALLSAIFFGAYLLIVERLRLHISVSNILFWRCLFCIVFLFPILLFNGDRFIPDSGLGWLAITCLALTFIIGHGMLTNILKIFSSSIVAVVYLLEPFWSSIQAWIFFAENLSILEWISFLIVILGVYLAISSPDRETSE